MISTRMVSRDRSFFAGIETAMVENNFKTEWSPTGATALAMLLVKPIDLIIIDEKLPDMTGRQFIGKVMMKNPRIHCIVASPLTKKKFHQAYEGLGVLMQFPVMPGGKEVQKLLERMEHIFDLKVKQ